MEYRYNRDTGRFASCEVVKHMMEVNAKLNPSIILYAI